VVERDDLGEVALTLGARLCKRLSGYVPWFAREAIALAKRPKRELDLRTNMAAMLACHTMLQSAGA